MKYKIVVDSSANMFAFEGIDFDYVPLKIVTDEKEYVDDDALDIPGMVEDLKAYKGRSGSACPNAMEWLEAFGDADIVFGITITGTLSGCHNSGEAAAREYEQMYPGRKVHMIDSLSTGPEMQLLAEKIRELMLKEHSYESMVRMIEEYGKHTHLLFCLESLTNLSRNGRVSPAMAAAAGVLGIRVVGKASERGELEQVHKCRGEKKALLCMYGAMKKEGYKGGRVRIAHCFNQSAADELRGMIREEYPKADIEITVCGALCSFYAEKGGLLVGYED
ncbi:MAG: DegV family protein [Lachnospiraceae bacterium]|nr:DegV family protein [Lachnospiraceae bacterium]